MFLKNTSILFGKELDYVSSTNIAILHQHYNKINSGIKPSSDNEIHDCEGLLLIPGLINSHTHIGDSIAKDVTLNNNVDSKIHPVVGIKQKILKITSESQITSFMKNTCLSMIKKGITTFVDFREGGIEGINLLKKILQTVPIRSVILGRLEYYQTPLQIRNNFSLPRIQQKELLALLKKCDGLGISGPNENSNSVLKYYSKKNTIRAIHAAETKQSCNTSKKLTKKTECQRALLLKPTFLVHMTYASKNDLQNVAKNSRGIVICPRANGSLSEGIPNLSKMIQAKCNVAIGTDNVMVNSPDMFREMDYLWKVTMGLNKKRIVPREILKMATVNAGKLLNKKVGMIKQGMLADGIFIDKHAIDLEPMLNPHAAIIHRASEVTIRAVMIGGKIVYGKL